MIYRGFTFFFFDLNIFLMAISADIHKSLSTTHQRRKTTDQGKDNERSNIFFQVFHRFFLDSRHFNWSKKRLCPKCSRGKTAKIMEKMMVCDGLDFHDIP